MVPQWKKRSLLIVLDDFSSNGILELYVDLYKTLAAEV